MDLSLYLAIFRHRKWIILVTTLVTFGVVLIGTLLSRPTYVTSTTLRLIRDGRSQIDYQEILYLDRLLATYVQLASSDALLGEVGRRLGVESLPTVEAEQVTNTELMRITVAGPSAVLSQQVATGLSEILLDNNRASVRANRSPVLSVIDPPSIPLEPSSPRVETNLVLGLMLGLAGGFSLALLLENLTPRLYTSSQIEATSSARLLTEIPAARRNQRTGQLTSAPFHEAFRRLQTNLSITAGTSEPRTLMVASAERGEGRSTVATHLALAFARAGQRVLLADFDFQVPTLHTCLQLPNDMGLSTILGQQPPAVQYIQPGGQPNLHVLTSGPAQPGVEDVLNLTYLETLIAALAAEFDIVVFDTPAVPASADATALAALVDSVLLVVAPTLVRRAMLLSTLQQLEVVQAHIAGLIINSAAPARHNSRRHRLLAWRARSKPAEKVIPARNPTNPIKPLGGSDPSKYGVHSDADAR